MLEVSGFVSAHERMRALRKIWVAGLSAHGIGVDSIKSAVTVARSSMHVDGLMRLFDNPVFDRHVAQSSRSDPLFAVRHRHYLARGLSMAERVRCAVSHFEFEHARCGADYHAAVHSPAGLALWRAQVGDTRYSIVLQDSGPLRHEGPLSVVLKAEDRILHVTSFTWVPLRAVDPSANDGSSTAVTMFVVRNQSHRAASATMERFRADFPQNAPAYFCLAATLAVAQAHGHTQIAAIHHKGQVAYEPRLAAGFRRSYGDFWGAFGGECSGDGVYRMPAPIQMPNLDLVPSKHRARARARRAHWTEIGSSTLDALRPHLGSPRLANPQRPCTALGGPSTLLGSPFIAWLSELTERAPLAMF